MSSIKDVARRAGVSISTVSLAFNQPARVSAQTREQIFNAARELGFTLSSRRDTARASDNIMFVAPLFRQMYAPLFSGLKDACLAAGLRLLPLIAYGDADSGMYAAIESGIRSRRVSGIIFAGRFGRFENVAFESGIPAVFCLIEECEHASILLNNYKMGADMAHHLVKQGYRSIALIGDARHSRMRGFIETLDEYGIPIYDNDGWLNMVASIETCSDAYGFMNDIISTRSDVPEAIFCMTDMAALGVMSSAQSFGLKIPDDIAVAGCENIDISQLTSPTLTTMAIPRYEQGIQAFNLLNRMIAGGPAERIVMDAKLIERYSTLNRQP